MKKKTLLLVICAVVIVIAAAVLIFGGSGTAKGSKQITIEVVDDKGASVTYEVKTDAEYLQGVMDETEGTDARTDALTIHHGWQRIRRRATQ